MALRNEHSATPESIKQLAVDNLILATKNKELEQRLETARRLILDLMKVCDRSMDSEHDYKAFLAMNDEEITQVSAR